MNAIPNFENFDMNETVTAVGFGMSGIQNVGLGGTSPQTGYSMSAIAGTVGQSADAIGAQAHTYETNDNSDHTAKGYIAEAKKHVNESIDKAYESCKAMNEGKSLTEAMDTKYWAGDNKDTSGQGNKDFEEKSKDFDDTFSLACADWNIEADGPENRIKGNQVKKIEKLAKEFFKKEGYISVNIAQAMIAQES